MDNKDNQKREYMRSELAKTIIFCGVVLILVAALVIKYTVIVELISKVFLILRPLIIGGVIALILNQPVNKLRIIYQKPFDKLYDKKLAEYYEKKKRKMPKKITKPAAAGAIITCYLVTFGLVAAFISYIIPQIVNSLQLLSTNYEGYYVTLEKMVARSFSALDKIGIETDTIMEKSRVQLESFMGKIPDYITWIGSGAMNFLKIIIHVAVGVIFSIYIISSKHTLKINSERLAAAVFRPKQFNIVKKYTMLTFDTFANFFNGQLLEALILGMLCFIGMTVFKFQYAALISVIVALTNLVPIVGPWIGTIPSVGLLLLVEPKSAPWFILFIIVLQQLESNLIYPRVVGNSVGLPPFWVLLAVVVGSGFGNVLGMIIAIPIMSIIYCVVKDFVQKEEDNNESEKV